MLVERERKGNEWGGEGENLLDRRKGRGAKATKLLHASNPSKSGLIGDKRGYWVNCVKVHFC